MHLYRLACFHTPPSCLPLPISCYWHFMTHLNMPHKSSKNLCIHNVFMLEGQQPTLPCLHPDCPQYFFNCAGQSNHMRATHPSDTIHTNVVHYPQASQPQHQDTLQWQWPLSLATADSPSSHMFQPSSIKDDLTWCNIWSSSPVYHSDSPSYNKSDQSSQCSSRSLGYTDNALPVKFSPQSDTNSLQKYMDIDLPLPSSHGVDKNSRSTLLQDTTSGSEATSLQEDGVGIDDDSQSMPSLYSVDDGTESPPQWVWWVFHQHMNGKVFSTPLCNIHIYFNNSWAKYVMNMASPSLMECHHHPVKQIRVTMTRAHTQTACNSKSWTSCSIATKCQLAT